MFHLKLLGQFELTGPSGRIALSSTKLSAFLAYLALAAKPVPREQLTTLLWGSHFEDQARQNFRQALARLRKAIGPEALIANEQTVQLSPDAMVTDVGEFETLVRSGSPDDLRRAVTLLDGDLLAGIDVKDAAWDEWLSGEQRRMGNMACDALERLGRIELDQARGAEALRLAEDCIRRDIFREDAHRLAIQAFVSLGRRSEAVKHYQHLAERLKQELGASPEVATVLVYEQARQQSGVPEEAPPPQPLARKPSIAVLPFANLSNETGRTISSTAWSMRLLRHFRGCTGCSSSPELKLHLQGPGRRCEAGGPRTWGSLCAGRQRAQGRQSPADRRPADRHGNRCCTLGGPH